MNRHFPVQNAYQQARPGGWNDVFVTQLDFNGNILWSTYLGGSLTEGLGGDFSSIGSIAGIHVATYGGDIIVTGNTYSKNFPHSFGKNMGEYDIFLTRFSQNGKFEWRGKRIRSLTRHYSYCWRNFSSWF